MVTATQKTPSLVKGTFKGRLVGLWSNDKCCLNQILFILAYTIISLMRQILTIARNSVAYGFNIQLFKKIF